MTHSIFGKKLFSSKAIAILIAILVFIVHFIFRKYNYLDFKNVLGWDVLAYYIYLPFTFIHGDPGISDQSIVQYIFDTYQPSGTFYQAYPLPNGNWSPMYTLGFAILYFPFFLLGHLWALMSDYPADGFSYPYQFAISNGVMLYIIGGIFIFRKFLLNFFSDAVTALTLLFMLLGTSFFHESVADECGPHAMMFAGFACILYLNQRWHARPKAKTAFLLGLVSGLCILARGSGIFIAIIPVLWQVYDKESLFRKVELIRTNWKQILIGLVGLGTFPLVQIIYWKFITGEFIFNTYQVTPGFDWLEPHFQKVFFSYKKGWLLYTPMIAFCILGLFFLAKKNKKIAFSVLTFFAINVYVISAWGTWWQGGSFGSRYFVESYAILALPLGYFVQEVRQKFLLKWAFYLLAFFFVFLNLFQTWQFNNFIFDGYSMTKEYYWKVFLKTTVSAEDRKYREIIRDFGPVDHFDNPQDYNHHTEGFLDFENANTLEVPDFMITDRFAKSAPNSCIIDPSWTYGPTFKIPYHELTDREHAWIKVSFDYLSEFDIKESNANLVIEMDHNNGQYIEKRRDWSLTNYAFKINEWNYFETNYLTPYPLSTKNDVFKIYVYAPGAKPLYIDNFKIEVYERKW
jgi:hypothetical protein